MLKMKLGAEVRNKGTFFTVWAPQRKKVEVVLEKTGSAHPLKKSASGYFTGLVPEAKAGMLYKYRLDGGSSYPDPCSRFQPEGPFGPSMIVDPSKFKWTDSAWKGVSLKGQVVYELHIGTFTKEGTYEAALKELPELKRIGITTIELMPVAECPGKWNWGYDGVDFFAPTRNYGSCDDLRRFVNEAHRFGLAVILDVVYNHFGPDGNFLFEFSRNYIADPHGDWGAEPNYDRKNSHGMRTFVIQNAAYWIAEYHFDGLRLDATQNVRDKSKPHILSELSREARKAAGKRSILIFAENEGQNVTLLKEYGIDAVWSDDFHHSARIALTGQREAYLTDYLGTSEELAAAVKHGFLYQGQYYAWQRQRRGSSTVGLNAPRFVFYLQNHDQVANHYLGTRLDQLGSPDLYRALTALLFLSPCTPLMFMGQEFGASHPFAFFVDHKEELKEPIKAGRKKFLSQFPSFAKPEAQAKIPDPSDPKTFHRAKIDFSERKKNAAVYKFHKDLLKLRRDPVVARQNWSETEAAVLNDHAFLLRYFDRQKEEDRLLVINLGRYFHYQPMPEPLLAPPNEKKWKLGWNSRDSKYGRHKDEPFRFWHLPAESALFFKAVPSKEGMKYE